MLEINDVDIFLVLLIRVNDIKFFIMLNGSRIEDLFY